MGCGLIPATRAGDAVPHQSVSLLGGKTQVASLGDWNFTITPVSDNWHELAQVDPATLIREPLADSSIKPLLDSVKLGVKKKNVSFHEKSGLLYRSYTDTRGRMFEQRLIPQKYRSQLLDLAHENACAGHLGLKKMKARLAQEYYWPNCWKDIEGFVRSCDTCKRVGQWKAPDKWKVTDKWKAPMKLVPVITDALRNSGPVRVIWDSRKRTRFKC